MIERMKGALDIVLIYKDLSLRCMTKGNIDSVTQAVSTESPSARLIA